jgi:Ras-related protein Ral-A
MPAGRARNVRTYCVALVGAEEVGKSALCISFMNDIFIEMRHDSTISDRMRATKTLDGESCMIELCEFTWPAFSHVFEQVCFDFARSGQGCVMFVFDLTRNDTLISIREAYESMRRRVSVDSFKVLLVATKSDLTRCVTLEEIKQLTEYMKCDYVETSAKTKLNVERVFFESVKLQRAREPPGNPLERRCEIL